jgi:hypothetical protein
MSDHDQPHNVLRGEFTAIGNRLHVHEPQATATHALAVAHQQMVLELSCIAIPRIFVDPEPEEFEDAADYLIRVAQVMDRWLRAVGDEIKSNASTKVDLKYFEDQFVSAINGWSTAEADKAAAALREERDSYSSDTDYRRVVRMEMRR